MYIKVEGFDCTLCFYHIELFKWRVLTRQLIHIWSQKEIGRSDESFKEGVLYMLFICLSDFWSYVLSQFLVTYIKAHDGYIFVEEIEIPKFSPLLLIVFIFHLIHINHHIITNMRLSLPYQISLLYLFPIKFIILSLHSYGL